MSARDGGGPAFPAIGIEGQDPAGTFRFKSSGMSLRDYYAGKALEGMCGGGWRPSSDESRQTLARDAYEIADAMIAARSTGRPE